MALDFDGSEGLFTRTGKFYKEYQRVVAAYASALNTGVQDIFALFASGNQALSIDGLFTAKEAYRTVHSGYQSSLVSEATKNFTDFVHADHPLLNKTLTNALVETIRQMKAGTESVARPTISTSVAAYGSNVGDAVVCSSTINAFGDPLDMLFDEDLNMEVTSDLSTGSTQYSESVTYTGEPALATTDYLWAGGSGSTGTLTIFDAAVDNLIKNADFETYTVANVPDNWTIAVGSAGSTVLKDTSPLVRGTAGVKFVSDGATLIAIKQQLSTSLVKPNKCYALNLWAKINTVDATGNVRFRLCDGNGTTISNDAGTTNIYNRNVNGNIAAATTQVTTFFQTPKNLPSSGVWLEISLTVSPTSGRTIQFDCLGLAEATQLYAGGPFVKMFSKATSSVRGDYYTLTAANNASANTWPKAMDRMFGMRQLGLYLPTSGSPTIATNLLT